MSEPARERFTELDLLRFVAAISVLVYHYKSKYIESLDGAQAEVSKAVYGVTKFGYLGVDLFFMISGFVICASAMGRTPFQFAVSRATRIFPTLWVCSSITVITVVLLAHADPRTEASDWLAGLLLLDPALGLDFVDGVYWTLLVELRFYLCVLLLLYFSLFARYQFWLPLWLIAATMFLLTGQPFFLGWAVSPEYSAHFIAGMAFFLLKRDGRPSWFPLLMLAGALPLACANAFKMAGDFMHDVTTTDRWTAAAIVAGFFAVFAVACLKRRPWQANAWILALGGMTYPLYLLHNRIGKTLFVAFHSRIGAIPLLLAISGAMLALAYSIHVFLERRIADRLKARLISAGDLVRRLYRANSREHTS
jgi:peptidoglycan/LPS O-acetylase OafA/YrhL